MSDKTNAERQKRYREKVKQEQALRKGAITVTEEMKTVTVDRSVTDKAFEQDRPGWYIFDNRMWRRNCCRCADPFMTRLEMNKFCSPKCKNEWLDAASVKRGIEIE